MKMNSLAWLAAATLGLTASVAQGQQTGVPTNVRQVSWDAAPCDCGEPACGCESVADPGCDASCETSCDGLGCDSAGGGSGCGLGLLGLRGFGECDLGEQIPVLGEYGGITFGGWSQLGYHSADSNLRFNSDPDRVRLQQQWFYAEKAIDTSNGFDFGGRIDYLYGTDAQDTQAFGQDSGWDTGWDNGIYGHAIPQLYAEAGYGDFSVRVGHFFTLIGFEVVAAPDNFFYSHAYTMYNSEPFTHTGALATYKVSDQTTVFGGYTFGWDSGFEDNGDNFLGGFSQALTDDVTLTYATTMGRFSQAGERGYMHSIVIDTSVTEKLSYIFQSDYLDTEFADGTSARNTFGINQYLIYQINDCWAAGTRAEWYNIGDFNGTGGNTDVYDLTAGLNYRPHANVLIRPELRWDFVKEDTATLNTIAPTLFNENNRSSQFTFGMDTIFLF